MFSRPARVLGVDQGEGRLTALVVGLSFVAMGAYAVGQSGIDALFFNRIGPAALPWLYLLQGGTSFAAMLVLTGTLGRLGRRRLYLTAPLVLGAVVLVERAVIPTGAGWIYFALSVTGVLAGLVQGIFVWGTAGTVVDTHQAKRLFPIFAAGGIFGSVVGGALTPPLAHLIGAENLLVVWAGGLGMAFVVARLILGRPAPPPLRRVIHRHPSPLGDLGATFAFVRRSTLLAWMTVAAVLFSVLFYLLYLPYARAAAEHFPKANELAGFFGLFWAASTLAAFLVSTLLTNRLFAWRGVPLMVVLLAALYGAAFGVLFFAAGFVVLVALRLLLSTWLEGVASPGWETLTNAVPERRRDQIRAFLNGGPTQLGTVIAGLLAIVGQEVLTQRQFAVLGLGAAALAVVATMSIRRSYAGALAEALRTGRPQVFERRFGPRPFFFAAEEPVRSNGDGALEDVLRLLEGSSTQAAGIEAIRRIEIRTGGDRIRAFVRSSADRARRDRDLTEAVAGEDDASALLRDAITERGRQIALSGLWAASVLQERREVMTTAIENLDGGPAQVAAALETIEAGDDPALVRPLLTLWERRGPPAIGAGEGLAAALKDDDPFIRECARLVYARRHGGAAHGGAARMSILERVLFLRRVTLFTRLSPHDLEHIARLTQERTYGDADVIGGEGELGEELFIVVEGTVRVVRGGARDEREIARRGPGDVIGEMSVITQAPRIASLVAEGRVRTIPLGRREFESVLRQRPEVALAVMRELVKRLA